MPPTPMPHRTTRPAPPRARTLARLAAQPRDALLLALLVLAALLAALAAAGRAGARPDGISAAGECLLDAVNRDAAAEIGVAVQLTRHGQIGSPVVHSLVPIAARRHATLDAARAGVQPGAWSAIAMGTGPFGMARRCAWPASGGAIAGGAAAEGSVLAAPFVRQTGRDDAAVLSIQNADPSSMATVEMALYDGGPSPRVMQVFNISPGSAITLDTGREPAFVALPPFGIFAIILRSQSPIAGDLIVDLTSSARGVADAPVQRTDAATTTLLLPRLRRGTEGDGTRVQLVNPGEAAGQAWLRAAGTAGACAGSSYEVGPVAVPDAGAVEIDLIAAAAGLPEGCTAAGVVTSTVGVLGMALETAGAGRDAGAYEAVPPTAAQRAHYAARWRSGAGGTTLDLYNPGPTAADVTLTPLGPDGAPVACRAGCALTIAAGAGARVAAADLDDDLPDDTAGALIVEATAPLAAVLGEGGPGSPGDLTLMTLVGLDPPAGGPFDGVRQLVPVLFVPFIPPTQTPDWSPTPTVIRPNQTPTPDPSQPTPTATATPTASPTSDGPIPNEPTPSPTGPTPTPGGPEPTTAPTETATPGEPAPTGVASETPTPGGPMPTGSATDTATPDGPPPTGSATASATPDGPAPTPPPPTEPLPTTEPGTTMRLYLPMAER